VSAPGTSPDRRHWPRREQLAIETVGAPTRPSPLRGGAERFVDDRERVHVCARDSDLDAYLAAGEPPPTFELAGPRSRIFFDPATLGCGIVTCGGLCPGLNNVVRSLVLRLWYAYGVRRILGFRYGYAGLAPRNHHAPMVLTPDVVEPLHEDGGTRLGTSRGPQDVGEMVEHLTTLDVGLLFVLGGDGGLRGAAAIAAEIARRGLPIAVIGVPKTIDNDLLWTQRSFGFATAVEAATQAVHCAHTEARAAWNGIGLVKLMGRHCGYITAYATLASADVNFCLVPEVPFTLEGRGGLLDALAQRLDAKHHAVIAVAEGAGQELFGDAGSAGRDASGNVKLRDIGVLLRDRIVTHFAERGTPIAIRYIDPSYLIRSLPANAVDAQYCLVLAQHAVHAGMAGRTNMLVGTWHDQFVHVPIALATTGRRLLDPLGDEWQRVLETTGQPAAMIGAAQ
jgi:6-phosphofructokinase 1